VCDMELLQRDAKVYINLANPTKGVMNSTLERMFYIKILVSANCILKLVDMMMKSAVIGN